ncbi:MAG: N-acetylmuramoyl-L-alanine amidase [Anaerolineales bacterium]|nr:N-acetylmuramoyl-L-alanine amidase [Anaerolineales bacterium]
MDTSTSPTPTTSGKRPIKGTFTYMQIVLAVAVVVATLFTAWTDPGLFPNNLGDRFSMGVAPEQTPAPDEAATPTPRSRVLIGIVAGHSGNDTGSVCADGLTERSVNETVATYVQQYLIEEGYDVDVLKEFDPKLTGYQASALVSIHADSCDFINTQATGYKVSSAMANPHPERAARLTSCMRSRYSQVTGLTLHNSITPDMTSYHAFDEVHPDTTSAIIEVGFLNLDRQILTQQPDLIAQGIFAGIKCYINNEMISDTQ